MRSFFASFHLSLSFLSALVAMLLILMFHYRLKFKLSLEFVVFELWVCWFGALHAVGCSLFYFSLLVIRRGSSLLYDKCW